MTRTDMLSVLALTFIITAIFVTSAQAATPDQILSGLAAKQTHSWIDNGLGAAEHVRRYKAGQRINITCMPVSEVARRLLAEQGYVSRVVQTITTRPWNDLTDGHAMLEVWYNERWQLYDVDANAQAVDTGGNGVGLIYQMQAVAEGHALWREIASDPLYHEDEPNLAMRAVAINVFSDPEAFYERAMGIAFFPRDAAGTGYTNGVWYIDASQTERLRAAGLLAGRYLADERTWYNLTGVLPSATSTPTAQAVAPAVAPITAKRNRGNHPADTRLVRPSGSTTYRIQCDHSRKFSRVIVITPKGKSLKRYKRNGNIIWRHPRGGHVKWKSNRTIINHARRTVLFVAFC